MSPGARRCLVEITDHGGGDDLVEIDRIRRVVDAALAADGAAGRSLGVALVDAAESGRLHGESHGDPEPTDVITWPDGAPDPETGTIRLGDLAVCPDVARAAAARLGRRPEDELTLYVLHGVLHLLGYDDIDDADRAALWAEQARCMALIGVPIADE